MWRMTWQALSYDFIKLKKPRVYDVKDDVAGIMCQALSAGRHSAHRSGARCRVVVVV